MPCAAGPQSDGGDRMNPKVTVIVLDGLRADMIDARRTPHLDRVRRAGTWFSEARTVFPSLTRVAAASLATGAPPRVHGVVSNAFFDPRADRDRVLDFDSEAAITAYEAATGERFLNGETFADRLAQAGRNFAMVHTGGAASAHVFSPRHRTLGQWVLSTANVAASAPSRAYDDVRDRFGAPPPGTMPGTALLRYAADIFVDHVLTARQPDVALLWLHEPDKTWHFRGLTSDDGIAALGAADAAVGRVADWIDRQPDADRRTLLILSDHGHAATPNEVDLYALLNDAGHACRHMVQGSLGDDALAITGWTVGSIWTRDGDTRRLRAVAEWLQAQDFVGAVFSAGDADGGGPVPGTLDLRLTDAAHRRQAPLLFTTDVRDDRGHDGLAGLGPVIGGRTPPRLSMHGGLSNVEMTATLLAAGPGFPAGATDPRVCGIIDVAPTLLSLFGVQPPATMTGQSLLRAVESVTRHEFSQNRESFAQELVVAQSGGARYLQRGGRRGPE